METNKTKRVQMQLGSNSCTTMLQFAPNIITLLISSI